MRLIDADELWARLVPIQKDAYWKNKAWRKALKQCICELENSPTVDHVKHGHWTASQGLVESGEAQCSNCKTYYYAGDLYEVGETDENGIGQALMPNYCPHCGAKMDEVEDG